VRALRHPVVLTGVRGVQLVDLLPGDALDGGARGELECQVDLDRVHRPDVMHDDADLAAVVRKALLPLLVRQ
jgi:hypothetical protein